MVVSTEQWLFVSSSISEGTPHERHHILPYMRSLECLIIRCDKGFIPARTFDQFLTKAPNLESLCFYETLVGMIIFSLENHLDLDCGIPSKLNSLIPRALSFEVVQKMSSKKP